MIRITRVCANIVQGPVEGPVIKGAHRAMMGLRRKLLTEELERLLEQAAPNAPDKTWAVVIAEALLRKARKGDVRAISELANRVEGKPLQAVELDVYPDEDPEEGLNELLATALKRMSEHGN